MAGNKFFNNQNIYVETDYDNIIVVDPNKVVDSDGNVSERLVNHEELVMYANLEAKIIPRSKLVVGDNFNDTIENIRIGSVETDKTTMINFMSPQTQDTGEGEDKSSYLDTSWTDNLTLGRTRNGDVDSQLLGITNISIKVNTSYAALVTIEMEDVQGRVLFEQGENSPYSAFFQLPYPLFTLTVKGYYGKAIRYELMLKDFNALFDPSSGNYKITTNFISRNYALLSDIPVDALFALPHMYPKTTKIGNNTNTQVSSETQEAKTVQTTRGYDAIKNAYSYYKAKGLIDEDFPELTLNQMLMKLENFERYVMEAYGKEDMSVLNDIEEYNNTIEEFRNAIFGRITDNWESKYISRNQNFVTKIPNDPIVYGIKKELVSGEEALQNISNAISDLDSIVKKYNEILNSNTTFGETGECEIGGEKIDTSMTSNIKTTDLLYQFNDVESINYDDTYQIRNFKIPTEQELAEFEVKLKGELQVDGYQVDAATLEVEDSSLKQTFFVFGNKLSVSKFKNNSFLGKLEKLQEKFNNYRDTVETKLAAALAEKIKSPDVGLGFNPTIKNVMAVICASSDGFLRLMDQVHDEAWEQRKNPIRLGAVLSPEKSEGSEATGVGALLQGLEAQGQTQGNAIVYPWPQYYVNTIDEDGNEQFEDKYPGDPSESGRVKSYLSDVWPEVRFVEEYIKAAVETEGEKINEESENTLKDNPYMGFNAIEFPYQNRPYSDLNFVPFMYEIMERVILGANYTKLYKNSGNRDQIFSVLSDYEYRNLKESVVKSPELLDALKNFSFSYENFLKYLKSISNNGVGVNWNLFRRGNFVTPYIKTYLEKDFGIYNISYLDGDSSPVDSNVETTEKLKTYLKANYSDDLTFVDGYPFNNLQWLKSNLSQGNSINTARESNDTTKMLFFNEDKKTIASFDNNSEKWDRKPITYFNWILNFSNAPTQEVSGLLSSLESAGNTSYLTNEQVINYYNSRQQKDLVLTESFIDYGTKYDTTKNFITRKQTTSLLNTPYFVNALQKGVENEKNGESNPYAALGYLYLNSLPISTLREKFKSFNSSILTEENYLFATLNKFSAIHKLPYHFILKYGSIWHRYKKFKNENIDILDDIWKDFDYKKGYDPNGSNTSKLYTFNNYDGNTVSIKQYEQTTDTVTISLGDDFITGEEIFDTISYQVDRINNGFYPNVINDVYYYFTNVNLFSGFTSEEIQSAQSNKNLKIGTTSKGSFNQDSGKYVMNSWTQFFEVKGNHDFREYDLDKVLMVPSFGDVKFNQIKFECFNNLSKSEQNTITNPSIYNGSVRSLWSSPNYGYFSNEMIDKPTPLQYIKYVNPDTDNKQAFDLGNDTSLTYSSIDDIFGVFTKEMLDTFETHFLNFCEVDNKFNPKLVNRGLTTFDEFLQSDEVRSQYGGNPVPEEEKVRWRAVYENQETTFNGININNYYINLKNVMKSLLMVDKPATTNNFDLDVSKITKTQSNSFIKYHIDLLSNKDIVFKIGNPGKIDNKVYGSFTTLSNQMIEDPYTFEPYVEGSLPTNGGTTTLGQSKGDHPNAWSAMYQYVGEFKEEGFKYTNNGSYLTDFFVDMDIEFTEENVILLSSIIKIYAGKKAQELSYNKSSFISDLDDFMTLQEKFQRDVLNQMFIKLNRDLPDVSTTDDSVRISKIDGNVAKLEVWKSFQTLNDKWISGQDFKNRTIFEDFLFLDRANRPVGDKVVVDISELEGFIRGKNKKLSVYGLLGLIYEENNFVFMPTPAYTNFYGRDERVKEGLPVPQDIPNDLFGTFMEVDTRDSRPRMLGIYVGQPSVNLGMGQNPNARRGDDAFDITNPSTCPLRENQENKTNYSDSNRCVGFQVDFGKRNQGVFNSVSIDMNQHKNIGPTFQVLAGLGQQASGQEVAQQSQSLYNFYRTRSYTCQVQTLGNVMIQPTMYFNLTNVPLFYGPYMIMNVAHSITNRGFNTNFSGVRIPKFALSPPDKLVMSVNKEILKSYTKKLRQIDDNLKTGGTTNTISTSDLGKIKQGSVEKCQSITSYENKDFVDLVKTEVRAQEVIDYLNSKTFYSDKTKTFIYGVATLNKALREDCYNNNLINLPTTKKVQPVNRATYFNAQTCIENGELIMPIASFNDITDCLNYLYSTFNPIGIFMDRLYDYIENDPLTTPSTNVMAKTLAITYMANIYEIDSLDGTVSEVYTEVKGKIDSNSEYKKEYDKWLSLFTSVVSRGDI